MTPKLKINVVSDLHLEFAQFESADIDCEVVVLAGDIAIGESGIIWARERWPDKEIIFVPGNHEYYKGEIGEVNAKLEVAAKQYGVYFLNRDEAIIGGVRFLGCTLWTDFNLFATDDPIQSQSDMAWAMRECSGYLADFRVIRYGNRVLLPQDTVDFHALDVAFLEEKLAQPYDGKTVVVTHHLPSQWSVADQYLQVYASAGFASDITRLFGKSVNLWCHGHTHTNFDYVQNGTRVICNPRGYVTMHGVENSDFNPRLVVDV